MAARLPRPSVPTARPGRDDGSGLPAAGLSRNDLRPLALRPTVARGLPWTETLFSKPTKRKRYAGVEGPSPGLDDDVRFRPP